MITAVIVLYYPDLSLLDRLIRNILRQVDRIYAVDNTPVTPNRIVPSFKQYAANIIYLELGDNTGIAFAQNIGIHEGIDADTSHILLLDQDSAPAQDMVQKLVHAEARLLEAGEKVAAVGPAFIDEKNGTASTVVRHRPLGIKRVHIDRSSSIPVEADYIISSGSLIRTSIFHQLGLMREELFIDWVDIEWCLRARKSGYKCYVIPNAHMIHKVGDSSAWALVREINLHADIRHYYIVRNAVYLLRSKSMSYRWKVLTVLKIPAYLIVYSYFSRNRCKSLALLYQALLDGMCSRLGRLVQ